MKLKLKKFTAMVLTFVLALTFVPLSAYAAVGIAPRVALWIEMSTDADMKDEIEVNEKISVTVRFRSTMAQNGEPITIRATGGAEILINGIDDVQFRANNVTAPIRDVAVGEGIVSFVTGPPATPQFLNEIAFSVKAAAAAGDFSFSVKVGLDSVPNNFMTNFAERTFRAFSVFYAQASHDTVIWRMPFYISGGTGMENISGFDHMIALSANHRDTGYRAHEGVVFPEPDGSFVFGPLMFSGTAPAGIYVVRLELICMNSWDNLEEIEFEIEYVIPDPVITVNTSINVAVGNEPFEVFGDILYFDEPFMVALSITDGSGQLVLGGTADSFVNGGYAVGPFSFGDYNAAGMFTVRVELFDRDFNLVAYAETVIERRPAVPVPDSAIITERDGWSILFRRGSGSAYSESIIGDTTVSVRGQVMQNGVPMANTSVRAGTENWAWALSGVPDLVLSVSDWVTTDANGMFYATFHQLRAQGGIIIGTITIGDGGAPLPPRPSNRIDIGRFFVENMNGERILWEHIYIWRVGT